MLFCHFHSWSGPRHERTRHLYIRSHTGATAETFVVRFIGFHPTKYNCNFCADKLLFHLRRPIAVMLTLNMVTDNEVGTSGVCSRLVSHKTDRNRESPACPVAVTKYKLLVCKYDCNQAGEPP